MDVERETQRARRQERQGLASAALVGYTNAGKSSLMRSLTASDVYVEDKLFATLDTTVRERLPVAVDAKGRASVACGPGVDQRRPFSRAADCR